MNEIKFNILILGDSCVGKTSLMFKFTDNFYEENQTSTIGIAYKDKAIKINNQKIILNIYDTSGQERYHSLTKSYLRNADGLIFVFDLTKEKTFENIQKWLITCDEIIENFNKIIVGNKLDLENREIDTERAEIFCEKYNMKYFETSAKRGTNVEKIFEEITRLILDNKQKNEIIDKENAYIIKHKSSKIKIQPDKSKKKKKCCK